MALSADSPPPVPLVAALPPDAGVASLYQEIILSHYRAPKHKGVISGASAAIEHPQSTLWRRDVGATGAGR